MPYVSFIFSLVQQRPNCGTLVCNINNFRAFQGWKLSYNIVKPLNKAAN